VGAFQTNGIFTQLNHLNHIPVSHAQMQALTVASLGPGWIRLHPESAKIPENITTLQQLKPRLPPEVANDQNIAGKYWEDNPTWSGACGVLAKLAHVGHNWN
jgi:hypothetical protein